MTTNESMPDLEFDPVFRKVIPTNHAERLLLSKIDSGNTIYISVGMPVGPLSQQNPDSVIRGSFLSHLSKNSDAYNIGTKGIIINGAVIYGEFNIEYSNIDFPISFSECLFYSEIIFRKSQFDDVSFQNCLIHDFYGPDLLVRKSLIFDDVEIIGDIDLCDTDIRRDLILIHCAFSEEGPISFDASRASVSGRFVWKYNRSVEFVGMHLPHASVHLFDYNLNSMPQKALWLDGFLYDALDGNVSAFEHIEWLNRVSDQLYSPIRQFPHQPWEQAKNAFRKDGNIDALRQINMAYDEALARFVYQTTQTIWKPFIGIRNFLYGRLTGYGHDLFRVWPWILGCMLLFWAWAFFAYHTEHIVPTASRVYMNDCYLGTKPLTDCPGWENHSRELRLPERPAAVIDSKPVVLPDGYPAFHSFLYTLDTFVPFADLHQEAYWTVTDDGPWGEWMRAIFSAFMALGGIFSAIFAAAMLSLIRKG